VTCVSHDGRAFLAVELVMDGGQSAKRRSRLPPVRHLLPCLTLSSSRIEMLAPASYQVMYKTITFIAMFKIFRILPPLYETSFRFIQDKPKRSFMRHTEY
jgi:hypothetical protein